VYKSSDAKAAKGKVKDVPKPLADDLDDEDGSELPF